MVDRIQGNNFREGIFAIEDSAAHVSGFNPILLAEILARVAQERFHIQIDEAFGEISKSDARLAEISKRIQRLVILQREGSEEIARALKEAKNDPSFLEWEMQLLKCLHSHRIRRTEIVDFSDQKVALEIARWLARQVTSVPVEMTPRMEALDIPIILSSPRQTQEPIAPPIARVEPEPCPVLALPCYEHRYKKMDAELSEVKKSLDQLRASIQELQVGLEDKPLARKISLMNRLFALIASLFGRLIAPGLNIGRQIVELRIKKHCAPGA
ncbi:MAG: hypothetical protein LLG04_05740 [Parachlamydia sp.]|nr:hypothetical protein [Parachlamydia sp.]